MARRRGLVGAQTALAGGKGKATCTPTGGPKALVGSGPIMPHTGNPWSHTPACLPVIMHVRDKPSSAVCKQFVANVTTKQPGTLRNHIGASRILSKTR